LSCIFSCKRCGGLKCREFEMPCRKRNSVRISRSSLTSAAPWMIYQVINRAL
jgi:hypothetical protein